jgi:branched-subunit amino acid ABC-type transport system permease component
MWRATSVNFSDELLVQVMAGSVIGGLTSITGAILGGLLVASSQKLLVASLVRGLGVWVMAYEAMIPILLLLLVLIVEPNGLTAIKVEKLSVRGVSDSLRRMRSTLRNILTE